MKLDFIESRRDVFSYPASDVRRHSEQMRDMVNHGGTFWEIADAKWERGQWRKSTFWMFWQHNAWRTVGFP